ncbi:glycoside hydrolase family 172 protein [Aeoliella sp. SH292]|uniref:glycoside hydrolase family 172 protein n=1 Tax=Aeoliella sp. SH292 TaxID=3454464 RepID=UPI003F9B8AB3
MHYRLWLFSITATLTISAASAQPPLGSDLFQVDNQVLSRSISSENLTGEPGEGGKAASELGVGRKGSPRFSLAPGQTNELCDIEGSGTIRHIWMTGTWSRNRNAPMLRNLVLRVYWDGQEHPSIECPLGDFMGSAHSRSVSYQSAVHSIGEKEAFNFWLPMPFRSRARFTLTNEGDLPCEVYYTINYTLNEKHEENVGRLHTNFRRANPTTIKEDFELVPKRTGMGRYLGTVMGIRTLHPGWWGEGEVKVYMDGDTDFPTLCGTGAEDYVGLSYGIQNTMHLYHGCSLLEKSKQKFDQLDIPNKKDVKVPMSYISMYRWHLPDPIYWKKECRITIQQIGCCYYERQDDWSAASFWYEPVPSAPLGPFPSAKDRGADLEFLLNPKK